MISDQIKKLRTENKMTQIELSKRLGVSRTSVNAWEMGISIPSLQILVELSKLFKVSVDYILELDSDLKISIGHLDNEERLIIMNMIKKFEKSHEMLELLHDNDLYLPSEEILFASITKMNVTEKNKHIKRQIIEDNYNKEKNDT